MNKNRIFIVIVCMILGAFILAACQPQTVEVTRIVEIEGETTTETIVEEVEVTRIVEGEVVTEVQEVEVTRVVEQEVEVIVDPTDCLVEAPAEEVELNMAAWAFGSTEFYAEELEKCNEVENLTVNTSLLDSASHLEQVSLALSTGGDSPYDILHGANGQIPEWGGQGWLMPLNDLVEQYWDEYNLGDIPETVWEDGTLDGNIYGIPIVANAQVITFRQDVFDELGLEVPDTYDEVIEVCNEVGLDNPDWDMPFSFDFSRARGWELEFFMLLRAYGGDYLDENGNPIFNSEEGVQALNTMLEVMENCVGEDGMAFGLNEQEIAMAQGTLPAFKSYASRAANMEDPEVTDLVDVISFAPAPRVGPDAPRAGSAWTDFFFIPATTTNDPDLIFRVIMDATDERSQQEAAEIGMVTRLSAGDSGGNYLPAANTAIAEGIGNYDKNPAVNIAIAKLVEFLPLVGTGEMTPQEALDAAAEGYIEEASAQGYITE